MSKHAFEQAMNQLGAAAEKQRQQELLAQRRQRIFQRIRQIFILLIGASVIGAGFYFREDLQTLCSEKLGIGSGPKMSEDTAQSLKEIQQQAAKRDNVLDDLAK